MDSADVDSWFASTGNSDSAADDNDGLVMPPHYFPTPKRTGDGVLSLQGEGSSQSLASVDEWGQQLGLAQGSALSISRGLLSGQGQSPKPYSPSLGLGNMGIGLPPPPGLVSVSSASNLLAGNSNMGYGSSSLSSNSNLNSVVGLEDTMTGLDIGGLHGIGSIRRPASTSNLEYRQGQATRLGNPAFGLEINPNNNAYMNTGGGGPKMSTGTRSFVNQYAAPGQSTGSPVGSGKRTGHSASYANSVAKNNKTYSNNNSSSSSNGETDLTVVKAAIEVLSQAASSSLKAVELANTLRARVGIESLGQIRERWGGLLALLEKYPDVFRVSRIPKNDVVTLIATGQTLANGLARVSPSPTNVNSNNNNNTANANPNEDHLLSRFLHLGNLPPHIVEDNLTQELQNYGDLDGLRIVTQRNRRFAFVSYKSIEQAVFAKQMLSRSPHWQGTISFAHNNMIKGNDDAASSSNANGVNNDQHYNTNVNREFTENSSTSTINATTSSGRLGSVLARLCDDRYVPTQQWVKNTNDDKYYVNAIVTQLQQFGGSSTVSKLRGFLRNRVSSSDNIKSVPLKALLYAYPENNQVSLITFTGSTPAYPTSTFASANPSHYPYPINVNPGLPNPSQSMTFLAPSPMNPMNPYNANPYNTNTFVSMPYMANANTSTNGVRIINQNNPY